MVETGLLTRRISQMKHALAQHSLLVTAAVHPWQNLGAAAWQALDRVHLMAYDLPGQHSTLPAAKHVVRQVTQTGVPLARLALGIPAYGRSLRNPGDARTYADLVRDAPEARNPRTDETDDGVYYNGPATVQAKAAWARQHGARAGGVGLPGR